MNLYADQGSIAHSGASAERAPLILTLSGKVGYYADFIIYGTLVMALVASLPVLAGVFFLPMWRLFSPGVAFGALSGLIAGWLWYGIVHHVIHHRRPRRLWDHLFGTRVSPRTRAMSVAVPGSNKGALPVSDRCRVRWIYCPRPAGASRFRASRCCSAWLLSLCWQMRGRAPHC